MCSKVKPRLHRSARLSPSDYSPNKPLVVSASSYRSERSMIAATDQASGSWTTSRKSSFAPSQLPQSGKRKLSCPAECKPERRSWRSERISCTRVKLLIWQKRRRCLRIHADAPTEQKKIAQGKRSAALGQRIKK